MLSTQGRHVRLDLQLQVTVMARERAPVRSQHEKKKKVTRQHEKKKVTRCELATTLTNTLANTRKKKKVTRCELATTLQRTPEARDRQRRRPSPEGDPQPSKKAKKPTRRKKKKNGPGHGGLSIQADNRHTSRWRAIASPIPPPYMHPSCRQPRQAAHSPRKRANHANSRSYNSLGLQTRT